VLVKTKGFWNHFVYAFVAFAVINFTTCIVYFVESIHRHEFHPADHFFTCICLLELAFLGLVMLTYKKSNIQVIKAAFKNGLFSSVAGVGLMYTMMYLHHLIH